MTFFCLCRLKHAYDGEVKPNKFYPTLENGDDEQPNEAGLKYYDAMFDEMLKRGMQPLITLSHYETPVHLVDEYGSWRNRKLIGFFLRYCETVFKRYKDKEISSRRFIRRRIICSWRTVSRSSSATRSFRTRRSVACCR